MMKAVIYEKYGSPSVLQPAEVDKPIPKQNEILIKIYAAEATKADCELRSFNFPVKWFWLPLRVAFGITRPKNKILGGYFSGEVESVGEAVSSFRVHQKVFGCTGLKMGAYAEYLCLPDSVTLVDKPENLSFAQAAVVPLGGLNALHYLRRANIQPGEKVLINGAGGSIGIYAVQIAKQMGAEVTAVDSESKRQLLLDLGVDHFIDYASSDFSKNGQSYDVIFNMIAHCSYSGCVNSLNAKGRYLMGNPRFSHMLRSLLTPRFSDKMVIFAFAGEKIEELEVLKVMLEKQQIRAIVDKVYSFEQAAEAHQRVETEQRIGGVVIASKVE